MQNKIETFKHFCFYKNISWKIVMQHLWFRGLSIIIGILCMIMISFFDYLGLIGKYSFIKFLIKLTPLLLMVILPIVYSIKYKMTLYSFFITIALFLCLLGDIFLGLYDPNLDENAEKNRLIYLSLGGGSFLMARMLFLLIFMTFPYERIKLIRYNVKKMIVSHILFNIPFIGFGCFFLVINDYTIVAFLTFIYFILGFGFQVSYAFLRINQIDDESTASSIFAFIGMGLFNISDILLMLTILTSYLPFYWAIISNNFYWISMFLMSISVIRYPSENHEKETLFNF